MTRDILLTGTPLTEEAPHVLRAGGLQATFVAGALRWISWNGVEILRGISFMVRSPGWGTPPATLTDLEITEDPGAFSVSFNAHYGGQNTGVAVAIQVTGDAQGHLRATATIKAEAPFETNRSGFVILHPMDGFAGTSVTVEHASGPARDATIPTQISPGQPVMDMRAILHRPIAGLEVETRFEGDIFEMEDHRNWSDASFKTYNRPIGLPYPYILTPDAPIAQAVAVTIRDTGATGLPESAITAPTISTQKMPAYALPLDTPSDAVQALKYPNAIKALAPQRLLVRIDLSGPAADADLSPLATLIRQTGAAAELQVITAAQDAGGVERDLSRLADRLAQAGVKVSVIAAFAMIDEQSFQPGQDRPPHASEAVLAEALALHFPAATRIGGTPAFFTEFNRKQPDPALWQGLTFATSPVVHAADDASVMETLQALPHILTAARKLSGQLPLCVGPTGIGMRLNPYGASPIANDPQDRAEMAARDCRQRGLYAAAWTVGYLARIAAFAPERFAFGAPTGPFGLIVQGQTYAQVMWDDQPAGAVYPLFHIARWMAGAAGSDLVQAKTEGDVASLIWTDGTQRCGLIANLSATPQAVPPFEFQMPRCVCLDAQSVLSLSQIPAPALADDVPAMLDAYAVLYLSETI